MSERGRVTQRRVIALADSTRLHNFMNQPGAELFSIFSAIDTRDGSVPPGFDLPAFAARYGRVPLAGEMGCSMSHLAVMREFVKWAEDEDILVVAEDDARLSSHFDEDLPVVLKAANHADLVMLSNGYSVMDGPFYDRGARWLAFSPFGRRVVCSWRGPRLRWVGLVTARVEIGTVCYAITARAATRMIEHAAAGVNWVADDRRLAEELGLRVYHVRPYLAQQAMSESGSIRESPMQPLMSVDNLATRIRLRTRAKKFLPSFKLGLADLRGRYVRLGGAKGSE